MKEFFLIFIKVLVASLRPGRNRVAIALAILYNGWWKTAKQE
jgi:hypothetical protein